MKPLLIIIKTLLVGYLWSIIFIDGIRVVLLINWHFDIFLREHWLLLSDKWNSGEAISKEEMVFFFIIVSAIPLWLAGWVGLCIIKWEKLIKNIILSPLYLYRKIVLKTKVPVVIKKKPKTEEKTVVQKSTTIKKVAVKRAPLPSATLMQSNINTNMTPSYNAPHSGNAYPIANKKNPEIPANHALFNFDDDDFDLDFDFDKKEDKAEEIPSALMVDEPKMMNEKQEKKNNFNKDTKPDAYDNNERGSNKKENHSKTKPTEQSKEQQSHTPVLDILKQKGYDIIPMAIIKNTTIDYIAVSKEQIILCLVDKETGDWLADEEKFNDEEPLWFSESSHRISPVRKIDIARDILKTKLAVGDMKYEIASYVIIQAGNIINAEDMFEVWNNMDINVTRINRGSPKEIRLFSKELEICEEKTDKNSFEKLKKLLRSLA